MRLLVPALAIVFCLGSVVHAQSSELEQRARTLLAAGVEQSAPPQVLAKLGPELPAALLAIFARSSEARHVRLRALSMLAHYDEPRVTRLFARLLREGLEPAPASASDPLHPARSALVLRRAIAGLATRQAPEAELDLTRALAHRDAVVRHAAVLALAHSPSERVQAALAAQRLRETSPLVRQALTGLSVRPRGPRSNGPGSAPPPR